MPRLLSVFILCLLLAAPAAGQNYSCRDKDGQLHFSDNLANLPPECQSEAKELKPRATDNLNFVPGFSTPVASEREVEQQLREIELQEAREKRQAEQLLAQAEELVSQYNGAIRAKNDAYRSWDYSSREKVKDAERQIQLARDAKQQVLEKLPRAKLSREKKARIKELLEQIEE